MKSLRPALLGVLLCISASAMRAQGTTWSEAWVGSEMEVYLRALSVAGVLPAQVWSIRPFSPQQVMQWSRDSLGDHPWRTHVYGTAPGSGLTILRPSASFSYNSSFPWGFNDGAVWQGRGANAWGTFGAEWRSGILSIRFEPVAFIAQNQAFALLQPEAGPGANPYVDQMRPGTIDLPQRFGPSSYARLDPGQSHIRIDAFGATIGFTTENIFWGPAIRNPLLFGANAAGFPHLFLGTSRALQTPLGWFHGQVIYGQLSASAFAPANASDDGRRFGSGFVFSWMPPAGKGLEIGAARFFHRDWPSHFALSDLTVPFQSLLASSNANGSGQADNQLLSIYARVTSERAGLELFGEFGKNDHNSDVRDATLEPEQNSAWSVGFLKTIGNVKSPSFWSMRLEYLDGRITALQAIRGQSTFYDHSDLTEGHTQLGQLLGSPLLERTGGLEYSVDHWTSGGRTGFVIMQRSMPIDLQEGQAPGAARTQWSFELNATRFRGSVDFTGRAGVVFDLNRTPGTDGASLFAGFSAR